MALTSNQFREAETMRARLVTEAANVRRFCNRNDFNGDRLACASMADATDTHIRNAETPPGVDAQRPNGGILYRARQGDVDAWNRWMRSSANIVKSISGVDVEFSDATWSNLADRVADEVKEAAVDVAGGFSFGAGIAAVVALILWWKK